MVLFCVTESWLIREDCFWILTPRKEEDLGGAGWLRRLALVRATSRAEVDVISAHLLSWSDRPLPLIIVQNSPNMHNTGFFPDCHLLSLTNGSIWIPYLARYSLIFRKPIFQVVIWKSTFIWKMLPSRNWKPKDHVWLQFLVCLPPLTLMTFAWNIPVGRRFAVKITIELLLTMCFVFTSTNSMKYLVNWIPLNTHAKFPAADLSHVYEWSCWVSRHEYMYSVCAVLVTYPSGARCRHRQRLARWYQAMIGKLIFKGSKSGAGILDNHHPEKTVKWLCAQDTTLSRKCILSTSAGPRCQWQRARWSHQMIRWDSRPGAGTFLNLHSKQSAKPFCIQDTNLLSTCILTPSLLCDTSSPVYLHVVPLDMLCKKMSHQALYFGYTRTFAYVNLGCVDRSLSTALVNHPSGARIVDVWLTHELKSPRIIPFFVKFTIVVQSLGKASGRNTKQKISQFCIMK